ncbi:MAG: THUMP-like domain-containing protein [Phototrophicaceae bacterium]
MIGLADLDFLTSARGESLLVRLESADLSDSAALPLVERLRRDFTREEVRAALTLARLRRQAVDKFGEQAKRLYFTDSALQQASHPAVRAYRARQVGPLAVLDAGCGIGADSLAFAAAGADVLGIDIDPLRVALARLNAAALGFDSARFEVADITGDLPPGRELVFFDPARRDAQGRRLFDVERYQPPLSTLRRWQAGRVVVKLSPGVDLAQLDAYAGRVEFIAVDDDLKEAVLWHSPAEARDVQATLLTGGQALHWLRTEEPEAVPLSAPRDWLIEPNPALIRAGLVQDIAAAVDGALLDETIAYVTADRQPATPWVRGWRVLEWLPFNLKRLRAALRAHDAGTVTVKKRGSPLTPETLIPRLKLKGSQSRTLVLTRHAGQPIVMICADFVPSQQTNCADYTV